MHVHTPASELLNCDVTNGRSTGAYTDAALCFTVQIVTVLGAVLFSDYIFSWPNCAGLTLSMIGACWYAAVASMRATRKSPLEKLPHNGIEAGEKSTLLATKQ